MEKRGVRIRKSLNLERAIGNCEFCFKKKFVDYLVYMDKKVYRCCYKCAMEMSGLIDSSYTDISINTL